MKRSKLVPLIVIGSLTTLAGCGRDDPLEVKQQSYRSLDDCKKGWGDERNCSTSSSARSGGGYGGGYWGPRYYWDRDLGRPVAVGPNGETRVITNARISSGGSMSGFTSRAGTISRGGFGSFAHGFSMGG